MVSFKGKHGGTLEAILARPDRGNIKWDDVLALFTWLGAEVSEGSGSRVRVRLNDVPAVFHKPHPKKECSKPMVRSVRRLLVQAGVI